MKQNQTINNKITFKQRLLCEIYKSRVSAYKFRI